MPTKDDMRSRFLDKDGRPPPIRGILKKLGPVEQDLESEGVKEILKDVIQLQKLGIIGLDVAHRQISMASSATSARPSPPLILS